MYLQELPGRDHYVFYCKDQRHGGLLHMGKLVGEGPTGV